MGLGKKLLDGLLFPFILFFVDKTSKWFAKVDLTPYEGKYVSMVEEEIVYASEDPEKAYLEAKKKYPNKEIILWKVPPKGAYIF